MLAWYEGRRCCRADKEAANYTADKNAGEDVEMGRPPVPHPPIARGGFITAYPDASIHNQHL